MNQHQVFGKVTNKVNSIILLGFFLFNFSNCSLLIAEQFVLCDYKLLKNQLVESSVVSVAHTGINELSCLTKMALFKWSVGVFCNSSQFCGLAIDFESGFKEIDNSLPGLEVCGLIVRRDKESCEGFQSTLFKQRLIPSTLIRTILWSHKLSDFLIAVWS